MADTIEMTPWQILTIKGAFFYFILLFLMTPVGKLTHGIEEIAQSSQGIVNDAKQLIKEAEDGAMENE